MKTVFYMVVIMQWFHVSDRNESNDNDKGDRGPDRGDRGNLN